MRNQTPHRLSRRLSENSTSILGKKLFWVKFSIHSRGGVKLVAGLLCDERWPMTTVRWACVLIVCMMGGFSGEAQAGKSRSISALLKHWKRRPIRGLRHSVLRKALRAYQCARRKRQTRRSLLTIIDYSKPSNHKRLWVLDLRRRKLLFREWVAHGSRTGGRWAKRFSNRRQSRQTSLGVFLTSRTYRGKHGYSLRLKGLERGFNHHAKVRAIVMHGAWYMSPRFIRKHKRAGRSWGCPAVRKRVSRRLIRRIRNGTIVFAYHDGKRHSSRYIRRWHRRSRYLRCR